MKIDMVKIRLIACVLAVLVCLPTLKAQVSLTENDVKANEFGLVNGKKRACLYIDKSDFEVVRKTANLFSNDVRLVTGKKIQVKIAMKSCLSIVLLLVHWGGIN